MEKVIEKDSIEIFEGEKYVKLVQLEEPRDVYYNYTGVNDIEAKVEKAEELKIKKIEGENLIINCGKKYFVIGDTTVQESLTIKLPKLVSEEVQEIKIQSKMNGKWASVDTIIENPDLSDGVFSYDTMLKGNEYRVEFHFPENKKIVMKKISAEEKGASFDLTDFFPRKINLDIAEELKNGKIEISDIGRGNKKEFSIEQEEIHPIESSFVNSKSIFISQKMLNSDKPSLQERLSIRVLPEGYAPVKLGELEENVSISSEELMELVDVNIEVPELIEEEINFEINTDYELYPWRADSLSKYNYFEVEDNIIKNCIPGEEIEVFPKHPYCTFSSIDIIPVENNNVILSSDDIKWSDSNQDKYNINWRLIMDSVESVTIQIYSKCPGYILVSHRKGVTHHQPGTLKEYSTPYDKTIKIFTGGNEMEIDVGKNHIFDNTVIVPEEYSGF